ncbi:MAG: nuclear transport factor 2 family protein [Gammaproteobacteria bacterium]
MSQSDFELIQNHLARYCFAVDHGSADEIADLFWDDATLEFGGLHTGRAAIRACYAAWIRTKRDPVEGLRHLIYVPLIEIDGDHASTQTYVDADAHTRRSGRPVLLRSLYRDRFRKQDGEWRFAHRHIVPMRSLTDAAPRAESAPAKA